MSASSREPRLDVDALREAIQREYAEVAANPGELRLGERVVDLGCGAGMDGLVAAGKVGPIGRVIGVDLSPETLQKARRAAEEAGYANVEFREGYGESLPVGDGWADVVISTGAPDLIPDKANALEEICRTLKCTGRLQIRDILV